MATPALYGRETELGALEGLLDGVRATEHAMPGTSRDGVAPAATTTP